MKTNKSKILNYFILWIVLSIVSVKIKELVLDKLMQNGNIEMSTPIISFYEVHNTGAAFNLFTDNSNSLILAAVVCIIILVAIVLAKTSKLTPLMVSAMSLLTAGMGLNTFERIQEGYVTDYIYFTFLKSFPVFNLPDIMIVLGAFLLAFALISKPDKVEQ